MTPFQSWVQAESRRQFLGRGVNAVGFAALTALLGERASASDPTGQGAALPQTHFPARARNVIYLHMVGGPPQMDLYDYKPRMRSFYDVDLPDSVRMGQRLTTMTSGQPRFPIAPSKFRFAQHGQCGM